MTAALLRNEACVNAPTVYGSFKKCFPMNHAAKKPTLVANAQNRTNFTSNSALISTFARSRKTRNGKVTLKFSLLHIVTKFSFSIPIRRRKYPITITRKIGKVTLMLNKKLIIVCHYLNNLSFFVCAETIRQIPVFFLFTAFSQFPFRLIIKIREPGICFIRAMNLCNIGCITSV